MPQHCDPTAPEQVEHARAEMLRRYDLMRRAEQAWNTREDSRVGPSARAKATLQGWQARYADCQADVARLEDMLSKQQAEVIQLREGLEGLQAWNDRQGPIVCAILACVAAALLAVCAGVLVNFLAAVLVLLIGLPLTAFLSFLYVQNANALLLNRIESADAELRAAEQSLPALQAEVQAAERVCRSTQGALAQAQTAYDTLLKADPFWRAYDEARAQYGTARHDYERMRAFLQSRLGQLLQRDWRALRDDDFELYLKEVLECLGYAVRLISAKGARSQGDRGADLLVSAQGREFSIQAKGYAPDNHVGVDAVRDVYFAMTAWRCQCCAVITNSTLTRPAVRDATEVGCLVIDCDSFATFLRGQHPAFPRVTEAK